MESEIQLSEDLRKPMEIGEVFAKSGMFPDIKSAAQGAVKILAGREIGLSPFESMKNLYMVEGKLGIMSNALASLVKANPKYDYVVEELTEESCTIYFFQLTHNGNQKEGKQIGVSTFTFKDAAKAGIVNKDNWKNYPKNMLFARALANGVRWYCPDAACGWHVTEELEDLYTVNKESTITLTAEGEVVKDGQT